MVAAKDDRAAGFDPVSKALLPTIADMMDGEFSRRQELQGIGDIIRTRENLIGFQIGRNLPDRSYICKTSGSGREPRQARQNSGVKIKVSLIVCLLNLYLPVIFVPSLNQNMC